MSKIFESIQVSDEVKRFVDHSFEVVNKIHEILEKQGKTQRDLAHLMGKNESEISKWMQGTHNFTLKSIAKIESVLGERLIVTPRQDEVIVRKEVAVFYDNFLRQNQLYFKKDDVVNKVISNFQEYNKVDAIQKPLNQKSRIVAGETSMALAA